MTRGHGYPPGTPLTCQNSRRGTLCGAPAVRAIADVDLCADCSAVVDAIVADARAHPNRADRRRPRRATPLSRRRIR